MQWHSLCGDLIKLPYRNESFDYVSALDVLEHIKDDEVAVSEIGRILKKNGIAIITVPHRMKFYTKQDKLIGHYRRYEIQELIEKFNKYDLSCLRIFGVYGCLMKIEFIQAANPDKTEENIQKLRDRYENNPLFRKLWDFVVNVSSNVMKMDAKYHKLKKIMNMGFIFIKN